MQNSVKASGQTVHSCYDLRALQVRSEIMQLEASIKWHIQSIWHTVYTANWSATHNSTESCNRFEIIMHKKHMVQFFWSECRPFVTGNQSRCIEHGLNSLVPR